MDCCGFARACIYSYSKVHHFEEAENLVNINELNNEPEKRRIYNRQATFPERLEKAQQQFSKASFMFHNDLKTRTLFKSVDNATLPGKNWLSFNKNNERTKFINYFSPERWEATSSQEKKQHSLKQCHACKTYHNEALKYFKVKENKKDIDLKSVIEEMVQSVEMASNEKKSSKKVRGKHIVNKVIRKLDDVMQEKYQISLKEHLPNISSLQLKKKIPSVEKQTEKRREQKQLKQAVQKQVAENDSVTLLATGKSFSAHDRERLLLNYEDKTGNQTGKKDHVGKLSAYNVDASGFLEHLAATPVGSNINWNHLASNQFPVRSVQTGSLVKNGNQVLQKLAKTNGIDPHLYNPNERLAGRNYDQRNRKCKRKLEYNNISLDTIRPAKVLKSDINQKIKDGELSIGERILLDDEDGCEARKFPLKEIRERETERLLKLGVCRGQSDDSYSSMSRIELQIELFNMGIDLSELENETTESLLEVVRSRQRTRYMVQWHDHSSIANKSYFAIMVHWIWNKENFLTDAEFLNSSPALGDVSVQQLVEKPHLYMLSQSPSTDAAQLKHAKVRLEDMKESKSSVMYNGILFNDINRFFVGDTPAREIEAGQQRGGSKPCPCGASANQFSDMIYTLRKNMPTLEQKMQHLQEYDVTVSAKISAGKPLSITEMQSILDIAGEEFISDHRDELQKQVQDVLNGLRRNPFILNDEQPSQTNLEDCNMDHYEVLCGEPLHDLSNFIKMIVQELPHHFNNREISKRIQALWKDDMSSKQVIRGCDCRLHLISLCQMLQEVAEDELSNNDKEIIHLLRLMEELCHISYLKAEARETKKILRLYNITFLIGYLTKSVIGNEQKTKSNIYGIYFHNIIAHMPATFRLVSLSSVNAEQQERIFSEVRDLTDSSSMKVEHILKNTFLRISAKSKLASKSSSAAQQSQISKEGRKSTPLNNTTFSKEFIAKNERLMQAHFEQIADYLKEGEGVWFQSTQAGIEFFDGPNCISHSTPCLFSYTTQSLVDVSAKLNRDWAICMEKPESIPLSSIRIYNDEGKLVRVHRKGA